MTTAEFCWSQATGNAVKIQNRYINICRPFFAIMITEPKPFKFSGLLIIWIGSNMFELLRRNCCLFILSLHIYYCARTKNDHDRFDTMCQQNSFHLFCGLELKNNCGEL